jgi:Cu+-exporting ATPase
MSESALRDYEVEAPSKKQASKSESRLTGPFPTIFFLPIALGILGAAAMLAVYLTILGLVQGWGQVMQLFRQDAYLVVPITLSFGVQVGLYTYLRAIIRARSRSGGAITGASGATSTAAMAACCAHRVADLLPFLGLSAAAGFLAAYKVPFMIFGLAVSLAGIAVMLRRIVRYRTLHMRKEMV